jgi:hypothetical protein
MLQPVSIYSVFDGKVITLRLHICNVSQNKYLKDRN